MFHIILKCSDIGTPIVKLINFIVWNRLLVISFVYAIVTYHTFIIKWLTSFTDKFRTIMDDLVTSKMYTYIYAIFFYFGQYDSQLVYT